MYVAETGYTTPPHIGFEATVLDLQKHRLANPRFEWATDIASLEHFVDSFTESRLRQTYGSKADSYLIGAPATAQSFPWPPLRSRAPGAAAVGAAKVKAGVGLVRDFLGPTLKAVPHALAEKRASVCVTCPQNQKGGLVAHLGGEGLKLMLQARTDLKLETSFDANLYDCVACDCNLHLKPHVELAFILERTTPEVMAKLDARCWILKRDQL